MNALSLLFCGILLAGLIPVSAVPLVVEAFHPEESRITTLQNGELQIAPGGPLTLRLTPQGPIAREEVVLECEVFSLGGCQSITALIDAEKNDAQPRALPDINHSEAWAPYVAHLDAQIPLPDQWRELQLQLPFAKEASLQIRNARLRPALPDEFSKTETTATTKRDALLQHYLATEMPAAIERVEVGRREITIQVSTTKSHPNLYLAEVPIHRPVDDDSRFENLSKIKLPPGETLTITRPRHRDRDGRRYDSLPSRWQLVTFQNEISHPVSHARFADEITPLHPDLPAGQATSKKGLGGWSAQREPRDELTQLDIAAVTVNVLLGSLLKLEPTPGTTPFQWQGRTYYTNAATLAHFDETFLKAQQQGALVSVVLLVQNPARVKESAVVNLMGHPDAHREGVYAMPAMDSEAGTSLYGAALHLLASRYSRPDGKHGRIHHYIVHNEVDAGWTWTNCGVKPADYYFDLYHRSMRLVDTIVREHDPHARAFISLTHHWAETNNERFYPSKDLMEKLALWCHREGDFPWALAYHPYPQSLRNPRTWEDEQATFTFDSRKITPRNIEVLDAWMKQPMMRDHKGQTRPIHLSENGFNSPDYSEKSLHEQAAAMAYAWKKIAPLDTVQVWHYHNWIDHRQEGGLRIGLRRFPDAAEQALAPKPIWHLYRDLATSGEDDAAQPYLETIGITDWSEVQAAPVENLSE